MLYLLTLHCTQCIINISIYIEPLSYCYWGKWFSHMALFALGQKIIYQCIWSQYAGLQCGLLSSSAVHESNLPFRMVGHKTWSFHHDGFQNWLLYNFRYLSGGIFVNTGPRSLNKCPWATCVLSWGEWRAAPPPACSHQLMEKQSQDPVFQVNVSMIWTITATLLIMLSALITISSLC